jgi:hypothetical protein
VRFERAAGSSAERQGTRIWPDGTWGSQKHQDEPVRIRVEGSDGSAPERPTNVAGQETLEIHPQEQKAFL